MVAFSSADADISGEWDRTDVAKMGDAAELAPGGEPACGPGVGFAGVRVPDMGGEELDDEADGVGIGRQQQREYLAKDCRGALGRFRLWRELGGKVREIGGAIRGDKEVLGRFRAELEDRLRWQRVSLGKEHSEAVRGIESKAGEFYREGLERSEKRAREAARTDGISVRYGWRRDQFDTFKYSMLEEWLEQVREIDGELAYGKMRRALEKASQEKARQVERARQVESARLERDRQETARQSRDRRGPERRGPERDFGPSR